MVHTVMKTSYRKFTPKIIEYRNYRYFRNNRFRASLLQGLSSNNISFESFLSTCNNIFDKEASRKKMRERGNHLPFMNKTFFKAIMLKTKIRNIFLKSRSEEDKDNYRIEQIICVQRFYCGSLNERSNYDNKKFWKVGKPCLSNKVFSNEKITLIEGDKIINDAKETAIVLNSLFTNISENLNIPQFNPYDPI